MRTCPAVTSTAARQLPELKSFWSGVNGYMPSGGPAQVFNVPASASLAASSSH